MKKTTNAVEILRRRYGPFPPGLEAEVKAELQAEREAEIKSWANMPGICRRCGGTFPTCCSCPDDAFWNRFDENHELVAEFGGRVPALVAEVRRLRAENDRLRKIEAAAKAVADGGDDRFHLYLMPSVRNLRDALAGKERANG